jgi:hypothetical protein
MERRNRLVCNQQLSALSFPELGPRRRPAVPWFPCGHPAMNSFIDVAANSAVRLNTCRGLGSGQRAFRMVAGSLAQVAG